MNGAEEIRGFNWMKRSDWDELMRFVLSFLYKAGKKLLSVNFWAQEMTKKVKYFDALYIKCKFSCGCMKIMYNNELACTLFDFKAPECCTHSSCYLNTLDFLIWN